LKYIVFIKYFERDVLEKLSILKETLQIKMMPSEEGTQSTMLIEIGHGSPKLLLAKQTFVLFFLISVT
jgi:hypothetical protein